MRKQDKLGINIPDDGSIHFGGPVSKANQRKIIQSLREPMHDFVDTLFDSINKNENPFQKYDDSKGDK